MGGGHTILVAGGTYGEQVEIRAGGSGNKVTTYLATGDNAIVDATGTNFGFHLRFVFGAVIRGFEVRNATVNGNGGIQLEYSWCNTLTDIDSHHCYIGMNLDWSGQNIIRQCSAYSNTYAGAYMQNYSNANTLDRGRFFANGTYGVIWYYSNHELLSNLACYDNQYGLFARDYATAARLENCVMYRNSNTGLYFNRAGSLTARNCIMMENAMGARANQVPYHIFVLNCLFRDNSVYNFYSYNGAPIANTEEEINAIAGCSNNIVANPMFRDTEAGDFKLQSESPCIDAGTTNVDMQFDMYGNRRLVGPAVDIGVYEMPPRGVVFLGY